MMWSKGPASGGVKLCSSQAVPGNSQRSQCTLLCTWMKDRLRLKVYMHSSIGNTCISSPTQHLYTNNLYTTDSYEDSTWRAPWLATQYAKQSDRDRETRTSNILTAVRALPAAKWRGVLFRPVTSLELTFSGVASCFTAAVSPVLHASKRGDTPSGSLTLVGERTAILPTLLAGCTTKVALLYIYLPF